MWGYKITSTLYSGYFIYPAMCHPQVVIAGALAVAAQNLEMPTVSYLAGQHCH